MRNYKNKSLSTDVFSPLVIAVRVSGGHLCEAEVPTEPAGETAVKRVAIRFLFNKHKNHLALVPRRHFLSVMTERKQRAFMGPAGLGPLYPPYGKQGKEQPKTTAHQSAC